MFVYDYTGEVSVNVNRIRAFYIDRMDCLDAVTKEEHDMMDTFRLKAFCGGRFTIILEQVTGKHNIPVLVERMHQITDGKSNKT